MLAVVATTVISSHGRAPAVADEPQLEIEYAFIEDFALSDGGATDNEFDRSDVAWRFAEVAEPRF
jgi:hypothetical protein